MPLYWGVPPRLVLYTIQTARQPAQQTRNSAQINWIKRRPCNAHLKMGIARWVCSWYKYYTQFDHISKRLCDILLYVLSSPIFLIINAFFLIIDNLHMYAHSKGTIKWSSRVSHTEQTEGCSGAWTSYHINWLAIIFVLSSHKQTAASLTLRATSIDIDKV